MLIAKHETAQWLEVSELTESERGTGGFGHTGIK
jgi:dUTP pyrophosphatase